MEEGVQENLSGCLRAAMDELWARAAGLRAAAALGARKQSARTATAKLQRVLRKALTRSLGPCRVGASWAGTAATVPAPVGLSHPSVGSFGVQAVNATLFQTARPAPRSMPRDLVLGHEARARPCLGSAVGYLF